MYKPFSQRECKRDQTGQKVVVCQPIILSKLFSLSSTQFLYKMKKKLIYAQVLYYSRTNDFANMSQIYHCTKDRKLDYIKTKS